MLRLFSPFHVYFASGIAVFNFSESSLKVNGILAVRCSTFACFQNEMVTKQILMLVCSRIYIMISILKIQCVNQLALFGHLNSSSIICL